MGEHTKHSTSRVELRERIILAAVELFTTNGIKSITMDEIAASLGISKRTLYEVFPDKETLLCDLACIGTAETIHALNRGENITIIFINNAIYGMTGGQMAPTTLVGMKTATCPYGRDVAIHGYPLKMTEIAATLEGTAYVTRQAVHTVPAIRKAKKAIRKAFENSMNGKGSNLVEIVSTCNSGWKMTPQASNDWMVEHMFPFYPLGDLKDKE